MERKIYLYFSLFFRRSQPFSFSKFVTGDEVESLVSVYWLPDDDFNKVVW